MAQRALKLGTRRSALARAQSAAIAHQLEQLFPDLSVQLVGIDTRGDRIVDKPLSAIDGKEFFTAEIDAALLRGEIDFTVHSYKDLSLERASQLLLAAVPRRAEPRDVVLFAPDAGARLAAGHELIIGSSSPRREAFVPAFLQQVLPRRPDAGGARVRLVKLRGNVDSRLRRLHEPRDSARQLDGVVLAFAGLARLWADEAARAQVAPLLSVPRVLLPLSACPSAPAQGALAIECRRDDADTAALLGTLDHAPTRRAVETERALLAQRGGGCQQRFGAVQIEVAGLGTLLYWREAHEQGGVLQLDPLQLRWTPATALPALTTPVRAWDGSGAEGDAIELIESAVARAAERLPGAAALFVAHRRALPADLRVEGHTRVWVPGIQTWRALAQQGIWVEGCAEGLGIAQIAPLLAEPWLQLPPLPRWTVLTHEQAVAGWPAGAAIATYRRAPPQQAERLQPGQPETPGPPPGVTHVFWASSAQFERWGRNLSPTVQHGCGPGKTFEHIRAAGVHNLHMFPGVQQWREWLQP
ncbi:MAG: hydroxymethylbilane synthase [Steroidobacteraceae bacterium]